MSASRRLAARCLLPLFVLMSAVSAHAAVHPTALTARFAAMTGTGWTGGDASLSVRLPDGRTAWLFGDTFIGGVDTAGRRDPATPLVRNSIVVQGRDGTMRTLMAHAAGGPCSLVAGSGPEDWYWPGPPVVGNHVLEVPMAHIVRTGPGAWDFKAVGTSLAVFALPGLRLRSVTPLIVPPGVNMASAVATSGRYSYIYGTLDARQHKAAFVARAPARELRAPWRFWNGTGWSADPSAAAPIADGVSDQFSVLRTKRGWALVTQVPMSRDIVAFRARSPQGEWARVGRVARVPAIAHAITYNATVHPEFSRGDELIVGFSVIADEWSRIFSDAALYRPRFMEIRLARADAWRRVSSGVGA
jgi:hypothetical protein